MADSGIDIETYLFTFVPQITEAFCDKEKASDEYKSFQKQLEIIVNTAVNRYYNAEDVSKEFLCRSVIIVGLTHYPSGFDTLMKSSLLNSDMFKLIKDPPFRKYVMASFPFLKDCDSIDVNKFLKEKVNSSFT